MADKDSGGSPLVNGVKGVGEAFILPGSSLLLDGEVKSGTLHVLGGLLAKSLLGPMGWAVVAANSYSRSVSGKHLHQHFMG